MRSSALRQQLASPTTKALIGVILLLALVGLGVLARSAAVTHGDVRVDELAKQMRFPPATSVFLAVTDAASEIVGICALLTGVTVLLLRRRRWDAFRLVTAAGAAWMLAIGVKVVVARPRPPASLWAMTPDASGSFPSGHDTTACVVVLVALLALNGAAGARRWLTAASIVFAAAVGVSRVYLGDHYPTDVVGSWLTVGAVGMLVWAVTDIPAVRRVAQAVLRDPLAAPAPTGATPSIHDRRLLER